MGKNSESNAVKLQKQALDTSKKRSKEELYFYIHSCNVQRLTVTESLEYLKTEGYAIKERTFFKYKKRMRESITERTTYSLENLMPQHFKRIDVMKLIAKNLWRDYNSTNDGNLKLKILNSIRETENVLFSLEEATTLVMDRQVEAFRKLPVNDKLTHAEYLKTKKANKIESLRSSIEFSEQRKFPDFDGSYKQMQKELEELESEEN